MKVSLEILVDQNDPNDYFTEEEMKKWILCECTLDERLRLYLSINFINSHMCSRSSFYWKNFCDQI